MSIFLNLIHIWPPFDLSGLHHVPKLGWTRAALKAGTDDLGFPPTLSSIVLQPDIGLVHHQFKTANDQLEYDMQKQV